MRQEECRKFETVHGRWMNPEYKPGLVSVIIPTYNRSQLLIKAMDSVWQQTYRPIELLIVDDGSTDATELVVISWHEKYSNDHQFDVRYLYQKNSGGCAARNLGLINSNGEFIQFQDSDDQLHPERFRKVVALFKQGPYESVHTGFNQICSHCVKEIRCYTPTETTNALDSYLRGQLWGNTGDFTDRRSLSIRIGPWDENLSIEQDRDYVNRKLLLIENLGIIPESLYHQFIGPHARISDHRKRRKGWESRLYCHEKVYQEIAGRRDLSQQAKKAYAVRLYDWAVKTYGMYPGIARGFGQLAESFQIGSLGSGGERMRTLWKLGRWVCAMWVYGREGKRRMKKICGVAPPEHNCTRNLHAGMSSEN